MLPKKTHPWRKYKQMPETKSMDDALQVGMAKRMREKATDPEMSINNHILITDAVAIAMEEILDDRERICRDIKKLFATPWIKK